LIVRQGAVADDAVKIAECIIGGSIDLCLIALGFVEKKEPILMVIP